MSVDFVRRVLNFTVLKVTQNAHGHYPWDSVRGYVRGLPRWQINQLGTTDGGGIMNLSGKKIVVIGGAGLVGSHIRRSIDR